MAKVELSKEQARELYYNINSYYVFLKAASNVDKSYFENLKFWNSSMNNHLRRSRESIGALLSEFNKQLKAINSDIVDYEAPGELYDLLRVASRLNPSKIKEITDELSGKGQAISNI